jgi:hypothetical protein
MNNSRDHGGMEDFISEAGTCMHSPPAASKMKCVPVTVLLLPFRDNGNSTAEHNCTHMNITCIHNKSSWCVSSSREGV